MLKNTSRRTVRTRGTLTVYDKTGAVISQTVVPDVPVLPESEREVAIPALDPNKPSPPLASTASRSRSTSACPRCSSARPRSRSPDLRAGATARPDLRRRAGCPLEARQQGSVQLSTETQIVQGSDQRRAGEHAFEPDFGVFWTQPQSKFGEFQLEVRGSRRGDDFHLGRT